MICQHFNELKATVEPEKAAQLFEYFGEIYYPPPQEQLVYSMSLEYYCSLHSDLGRSVYGMHGEAKHGAIEARARSIQWRIESGWQCTRRETELFVAVAKLELNIVFIFCVISFDWLYLIVYICVVLCCTLFLSFYHCKLLY